LLECNSTLFAKFFYSVRDFCKQYFVVEVAHDTKVKSLK
jgi:hypothetical protein